MTDADTQETWTVSKPAITGRGGLVASQHYLASDIGAEILARGGNAVDAAVAAGLAISTVEPWMSGLGGCGFMMIYLAKEKAVKAVQFGFVSPKDLYPADYPLSGSLGADMFGWPEVLENRNVVGPHAMSVPTYVAGVARALADYGSLTWGEAIAPAVRLAEAGMPVDWYATVMIANEAHNLAAFEASKRVYLPNGLPPVAGFGRVATDLRIGNLAATLNRLGAAGPGDFYDGEIAEKIIRDTRALGGRLSRDDLAGYEPEVIDVTGVAQGPATLYHTPGLTGGPTVRDARDIWLERVSPTTGAPDAAAFVAHADALQQAFGHRLATMGQGDNAKEPSCTTHLSVVDGEGNMVALTQTIVSLFGSRVLLPETGITMNNGIMWFDPRPGRPNSLAAGAHGLCNMCPMIVVRNDGLRFALGASGGRKILPAVYQLVSFMVDQGMDVETAMHWPRIDVSGADAVSADPRLDTDILDALDRSFTVQPAAYRTFPMNYACPNMVAVDADGAMTGGAYVHSPLAKVSASD